MNKVAILSSETLEDRKPQHALVADVDLVAVRFDDEVAMFYGRCLHRGALMSDSYVSGKSLICGVHYWDYRMDSGVSEYNNAEALPKFACWEEDGQLLVDEDEIAAWGGTTPSPSTASPIWASTPIPATARPKSPITA